MLPMTCCKVVRRVYKKRNMKHDQWRTPRTEGAIMPKSEPMMSTRILYPPRKDVPTISHETYQAEALASDDVAIQIVLLDPGSRSSKGKYLCNRHGLEFVSLLSLFGFWLLIYEPRIGSRSTAPPARVRFGFFFDFTAVSSHRQPFCAAS